MGLMGGQHDRRMLAEFIRHGDLRPPVGYFAAVRHPWPSLVVVGLLLAAYEIGVTRLSSSGASLRAGIELWLRDWLTQFGPLPPIVIPATLISLLILWSLWKWSARPDALIVPVLGIILEGVSLGIGLWAVCQYLPDMFRQAGLPVAALGSVGPEAITYIGVGIYEEAIFRLIGFAWLARLFNIILLPWLGAILMAAVVSAAAFAAAHHLVQSDPFVPMVFTMRMAIGVYLALVFWLRGPGVAIGAHIIYNLAVDMQQG